MSTSRGQGLFSLLLLLAFCLPGHDAGHGSLTHSRAQNRNLQRAIHHEKIFLVLEGVRERALNTISPDALLLINFPDIDKQFKVGNVKVLKHHLIEGLIRVIFDYTFDVRNT